MEKQIIITYKETDDEKYPYTYTVNVTGDIDYQIAINTLIALVDKLINNYQKIKNDRDRTNSSSEEITGSESTTQQSNNLQPSE